MGKMLMFMDGHQPCMLVEYAFLLHLLDDICPLLAGVSFEDTLALVEHADELWLARRQDVGALDRMSTVVQRPGAMPTRDSAESPEFTGEDGRGAWCFYHQRGVQ